MENNNLRSPGTPVGVPTNTPVPATAPTPLFADVTRATPTPGQPLSPSALNTSVAPSFPAAPQPPVANPLPAAAPPLPLPKPKRNWRKILVRIGIVVLVLSLLGAGLLLFETLRTRQNQQEALNNLNLVGTTIPLNEFASSGSLALLGAQSLVVNGQLRANESFILAPQAQPAKTERGQLYYDQGSNVLAYYNGSSFIQLASSNATVQTIQGQSGNVTLVAGDGVSITGTTIANNGVTSLGGQTGAIGLGTGLTISGGNLQATGVQTITSGSPASLSVTTDSSGNVTITSTGAGTGTVQSPGGTAGRIAMFTGAQTIEDSLISQSGSIVTVTGDLAVATGGLTLANALTVANGGTGATTLAANGVIVGNGTSPLTSVTAGGAGLCLLSTAGAPSFQACPGGASVTSVNGLTGALTIANASGAGTTITIDDASTAQKGIAQFNSTNFSASGGVVNTIQDISTSASPTFAGMTLTGSLAVNGGNITSTGALALTASAGNITLTSSGTIELQDATNVTGNLTATGNGDFQGGSVTVGTTSQGGTVVLYDGSSNTGSISVTSLGANRTYTLPDASGTICLSTGNCAGAGVTLQTAYNNSTDPEITVDATRGALSVRDNATPIGANLLEVQNNAGSTTYFGVSATGIAVTGSATASSNINSSGGAIQTNGTSRIDNSGNLVNIGNLTLSGAISGGTTYTGSGNINTTGGSLQTAGTNRVDNSGNLVNIGNITGTGAITIASSGAGNDITIDGADQFIVQDAANFNALATFNSDVDMTFAGSENLNITSTITGTTTVNLIGAVLTNNTTSGTQQVALLQNAAGSGSTEGLLVLDNADTDTAVVSGLQITSAAGGITNALDVSDADILTALLFGANDITGTNFSVTGSSGSITSAGNATLQGGTVTVGTTSQAGSLVVHDGSSNTGTIQVAALGQDTVYTLPDPGGSTATICLDTGNCAGTGGGITGSGTTNRLSKFTGAGTIGNSTISDDGTNVTTTVDVVVQGGDITVGTTSQLASLLLHDGNGQTTTLRAGDSSGDLTFILPTTAGTANQCLKQSGTGNQLTWQDCDGGGGGSSATLQTAYNNGNSITTSDGRDIDIVLANTTTDSNFDLVVADGSTGFVSFTRADGSGTADPAQLLLVDNLDTSRALPIGIKLQAAGGGMTTAIDATDAEIVDAISVGANNIVGTTGNIDMTNFDVVGASGDITTAGDLAVNGGNVSSTGALTITASGGNLALTSSGTIELQTDTNVTGNADVSGTLTAGTANAFQVAAGGDITTVGNATLQGGLLTVGTSSQSGTVIIYDGSTHTGSLVTTALSDNRTYTLPNESGTVCLSTGNCAGAGVTLQAAYNNSSNPEITVDATRGALTIRDNASAIGANLLEVQNNAGGTTYFGVAATGTTINGGLIQSGGNFSSTSTSNASLTANGSVTITAGGGSTWSTSSGSLTVRAAGTDSLILNTGGAGTVALGDQNTTTINIGRGSNIARTINIGTAGTSQAQAITMGSTGGTSNTTIQGGTGSTALNLAAGTNGSINVTTSGTGNINLTTASSIIAKTTTDNSNAFRILDSVNTELIGADTDNLITRLFNQVNVRGSGTDAQNGILTFGTPTAWAPTIRGIDNASVSWFGSGFTEDILALDVAGLQFGTGTGDPSYALDAFNGRHTFKAQGNFGYFRFLDDTNTEVLYMDENETTFRPMANATATFRVLNSSTVPMFQIDTTNNRIYMGNTSADSDGVITILDTKDTSGDPTGVNGGMYYNSDSNTFRCYENGAWYDCLSRHKIVLGSDVADSTGNACTMANITGLSFSVTSGTNYRFHANLAYTAAATTTGSRFSVNGPASPTVLTFSARSGTSATAETVSYANAYDGGTCTTDSPSAASQGNTAIVEGAIRPSANGTLQLRVGTEVDTSAITVLAGSTLEWW